MKGYAHDTYYYGGEIINTISNILGKPAMDRGGKFVWVINNGIVYCDLFENDSTGVVEFYRDGSYVAGRHVLTLCNNDLRFYSDTIKSFIRAL
jgi:hypothetical protein